MHEAAISEFPFVAGLPKPAKSRLRNFWDHVKELTKVSEKDGMPIPQLLAARLLEVSRQRVWSMVEDGVLRAVEVNGERFVTLNSVIEYAQRERHAGRALKCLTASPSEVLKEGAAFGRDLLKEQKNRK